MINSIHNYKKVKTPEDLLKADPNIKSFKKLGNNYYEIEKKIKEGTYMRCWRFFGTDMLK